MAKYKLTYFDFDGGRAEPVRIALHSAGLDFEDHRISFAEFGEVRKSAPFNAVPVLEIDGEKISQSNAMSRYVGKLSGLYPTDDKQALYCDEALGALEDVNHYVVQTFGLEGDALKQAREKLIATRLNVFLPGLQTLLQRGGGKYFADNRLSIADLKAFMQVRSILSGTLDHIPADLVANLAPELLQHHDRMQQEPIVTAYYASRSQ